MNKPVALVIAAHPDDEVLGCGGTILTLCRRGYTVNVAFMTDGESSRRTSDLSFRREHRRQAALEASNVLGTRIVFWGDFPDNEMDSVSLLEVVQRIEGVIGETQPSLVISHWHGDLNIDHQIVARAVVTATRPQTSSTVKRVLGFEIPSSTEWAFGLPQVFSPNTFVDIDHVFEQKMTALECYRNELREGFHPRSRDAIVANARRHGHTVGCAYAEALTLIRAVE
jgi:LmbE family N-acetylglucosaminyl deacetylase